MQLAREEGRKRNREREREREAKRRNGSHKMVRVKNDTVISRRGG